MQYLFYSIAIPFLYLNYKIIISDLKNTIIPNKYLSYLLLLLLLYYIYIYFTFPEINFLLFIGQVIFTFLISFVLYYFGIWAAGDAKYLLVLSLFIPYIGIVPFIGNIVLLTIAYLLSYFIRFYFGKCIFIKGYARSLGQQIKIDLNQKWIVYKSNRGGKIFFIVLKGLVIFLLIFVSIRLTRLYLFNSFLKGDLNNFLFFKELVDKYSIYLILLSIGLFIGGLILFKLCINKLKKYISNNFRVNLNIIGNILLILLSILLIIFIFFEYYKNPYKIKQSLLNIFTIYLSIYIIIQIFIYSYNITFGIYEYQYINIDKLEEGDIVDKQYLLKMFGEQISLGYISDKYKNNKTYILYPSPKKYFSQICNPIDIETKHILQKCYFLTNSWHTKNKTPHFTNNTTIKMIKTFPFSPFIIGGFIITYLFQNIPFKYLLNLLSEIFQYLI